MVPLHSIPSFSTCALPAAPASQAEGGSSRPGRTRLPEVDGLRGVAIWLILLGHFFVAYYAKDLRAASPVVFNLCSRFMWGVDLFFVISGFLIGGILLDHRHSTAMVKTFYLRRVLRIWPLYFFLVLLLAGPTYAMGFPAQARYLPFWSYLLFVQNIPMSLGFWALFAYAPLWSIAVEEQFYLAAPLLVRKTPIRRIKQILFVAVCSAVAARWVCLSGTWLNDAFTLCRLDAIAIGFFGALIIRKEVVSLQKLLNARALCLLAILMVPGFLAVAAYSNLPLYLGALTPSYIALFFLVVVLLAVQDSSAVLKRILRNPFLTVSGKFCYFLYLFHLTILYNVELFLDNPILARLISLPVCLGLAFISWRFFESPLIAIGHRWSYSAAPEPTEVSGPLRSAEPIVAVDASAA
jgi:peptidoglycan/LPS O-acetylase OafA/YrhL